MDGPLLVAAKQPRRKPARAAALLPWLIKHPLSTAVLYMLVGGAIMYMLLAGSNSQQKLQHRQQEQEKTAVLPSRAPAVQQSPAPRKPAASTPTKQASLCTDTCFKAKDGVCDDGRLVANSTKGIASTVLCDLGTDCSDCGVWGGVQNSSSWTEPIGPVEYLRQSNRSILTKLTNWQPRFYFAQTPSSREGRLNDAVRDFGAVEPTITHIAYHVLREACRSKEKGLMLDVGAGFGWYSILAGKLGCRVVAFEPVTALRAFMEYSIARNNLQDKVQLRPTVVVQHPSKAEERSYKVAVPQQGLWGSSGTNGQRGKYNSDEGTHVVTVAGETLDQVSKAGQLKHVALLRVEAKGHEATVMAGAVQLLQKQLIDNILMEYTPQVSAEHGKRASQSEQGPKMLLKLLSSGFRIGHIQKQDLGDQAAKTPSDPLETLPAVTEINLKYDLADSMQITENGTTWLKEPCKEMVALQLIGDGVPERLHPKSFGSSFDGTTNLWASRVPRFLPYLQGPAVGAFPAERKLTDSWFIPEWSDAAMGGRSCRTLQKLAAQNNMTATARAPYLIRHRCRCGRLQPCEELEGVADKCAQQGRTPFQ